LSSGFVDFFAIFIRPGRQGRLSAVIMKGDPRAANDIFLGGVAIQTTARVQGKNNQYAAGATAVSVLLQALAQLTNHA